MQTGWRSAPERISTKNNRWADALSRGRLELVRSEARALGMDVVVVDIHPRFGMLLSRSWGAKLKGTLQLDFSYATIPVFGQMRKLYREQKMKYMITSKEKPVNHPVNYVQTDLESFVLFADNFNEIDSQIVQVEDIPAIT